MGAFMLTARTGVPVLPVSLVGTRTLLRGESWRPHYSALKVYIGKPISPVGEAWQAALQLRDSARQQILARLGEPDATN
jgi:1-acyl-sn-glycerol-3-phosphate acyltransferase